LGAVNPDFRQAGTFSADALLSAVNFSGSNAMKSLLLSGAMIVAAGTSAFADGYWVVGNNATSKCDIVTSNPVINAQVGGNITFGSGPYRSLDDAKLARSTIGACPKVDEPASSAAPADEDK
jgi:hypothetical protein